MPKASAKAGIHVDLLRPQSNPEKLAIRAFKWLLSTGRFIFIAVEGLVLIAFIARFKLDTDLQSRKEAIDQQIPYIQNLKPYEILIRQTQLKLSTITAFKQTQADYPKILKDIADQTPSGIQVTSLNLSSTVGKVAIQINGQAQTNNDVSAFVSGLKSSKSFFDVNLTSVGIETGALHFTIGLATKSGPGSKSQ